MDPTQYKTLLKMTKKMSVKNKRTKQKKKQPKKNGVTTMVVYKPAYARLDAAALAYARLLNDPCSARMVHPTFVGAESGFLLRVRQLVSLHATASYNCGYVLWAPEYHNLGYNTNGAGYDSSGNYFVFETTSNQIRPINTVAAPLGLGVNTYSTNGSCLADPAYNFVSSATCEDARCIAACLKLIYTGPVATKAGLMCRIENFPLSNLLGSRPTIGNIISDYDYFRIADESEIKFRPGALSTTFKGEGPNQGSTTDISLSESTFDGALQLGVAGTNQTAIGTPSSGASAVIGFAWQNLTNAAGNQFDIALEATKVIEWRPSYGTVGVASPMSDERNSSEFTLDNVLSYLDKVHKGWYKPGQTSQSMGVELLRDAVYTGAPLAYQAYKSFNNVRRLT